ncbi:MAG: hypothetical protein DMF84_06325 [Acidobacteria bacterium]|nr:MAG: hypothetical protein DMF84_06325 [Acidobacteriota bacterium]
MLRSRGSTARKTIDCLIATFCTREHHFLLHRDRGFDPFENFLRSRSFTPEPVVDGSTRHKHLASVLARPPTR